MIVQRKVDLEEMEQAAEEMCRFYCRYPLIWDEQVMNGELAESELCRNCPMSELMKGIVIYDAPLGKNDWQE